MSSSCKTSPCPQEIDIPASWKPLHFPLLALNAYLHSLSLLLSHTKSPPSSKLEQPRVSCYPAAGRARGSASATQSGCEHDRSRKEWATLLLLGRFCVPSPSCTPEISSHSWAALWQVLAFLSLFHSWETSEVIVAARIHPSEIRRVSACDQCPATSKGRPKLQNHKIAEKQELFSMPLT